MAKKVSSRTSSSASAKKTPAKKKKAKKAVRKKVVQKVAGKKAPAGKSSAKKAVTKKPPAKKAAPAARKKSPLTKATISKFRRMLLEKRRALVGDMTGIEAETIGSGHNDAGDLSNIPTHPADLGTDNYEHEFSLGLLESERALLTEINEALQRIDDGTYGICEGTDKSIAKARLQARPWAKYCIEYARKIEQGLVDPTKRGPEFDK